MKKVLAYLLSVLFAVSCVISATALLSPLGDAFWVMTPFWLPGLAVVAALMFASASDLLTRVFAAGRD